MSRARFAASALATLSLFVLIGPSAGSPAPGPVPDDDVSFVLSFGRQGTERGEFGNPWGLAIQPGSGNIIVVDVVHHRVQSFDADGNFVEMGGFGVVDGSPVWQECFPTTPSCGPGIAGSADRQFDVPADVAFDAAGNAYILDRDNQRFQVIAPDSQFLGAFGSQGQDVGQFFSPRGIAVSDAGDIYVADRSNNRIQHIDPAGSARVWGFGVSDGSSTFQVCVSDCQAGIFGGGFGQLAAPNGVAVGPDGRVYAVDTGGKVQAFDADGNPMVSWGGPGSAEGEFGDPTAIAVDDDGDVFVADRQNLRIQQFDADGNFIRAWGYGVRDGSNAFQVCTASCRQGIPGAGPGQFGNPLGIAVDAGFVYVADNSHMAVHKFALPTEPDPVETAQFFVDANGANRLSRYTVGSDGSSAFDLHVFDPSLANPVGIAYGPGSELFAANAGGSVSRFLDPLGTPTFNGTIASDSFGQPHWMAFRNNELFVGDPGASAVLRFVIDAGGNAIPNGQVDVAPDGQHIRGVRFNPATGELFVSLCCGANRIERYVLDAEQNWVSNGNITGGGLSNPHGMAFSPRGELFVANGNNGTVSRFYSDGTTDFAPNGTIAGNMSFPLGVAFSPWGELFVANFAGVTRFTFDGSFNAVLNGVVATGGVRDVQFVGEPPQIFNPPDASAGGPYAAPEGTTIPISGLGSTADTGINIIDYQWDLGDDGTIDHTGPTFDYVAVDDADLDLRLTVTDDLGGVGTDLTRITVTNVAPAVAAGPDRSYIGPAPISVHATFSDVGSIDSHSATIDWGIGAPPEPVTIEAPGVVVGTHDYAVQGVGAGVFTVVIAVTDDDGGTTTDTTLVTFDSTPPPLPAEANVFVLTTGSAFVDVIDSITHEKFQLPATRPGSIAVTPDGRYLYAALIPSPEVVVLDVLERVEVARIDLAPNGGGSVSMSPDGSRLLAGTGAGVQVIDTSTNTVVGSIPVPGAGVFSPDGSTVWVMDGAAGEVTAVDFATGTVLGSVSTGGASPTPPVFGTDPDVFYAVNALSSTLAVIDGSDPSNPVLSALLGLPQGGASIAITPDGETGIISSKFSRVLTYFDTATQVLTGSLTQTRHFPTGLSISLGGSRVYVPHFLPDSDGVCTLTVIDIASQAVVADVPTDCAAGGSLVAPKPPIEQPPVADAGGPYTGVEGGVVNFDGTASSDPDDDIQQYQWDFDGDGFFDEHGPTPSRVYLDDGTFNVRLEVTDATGLGSDDIATVTIANLPPVVDAGPDGSVSGDTPFDLVATFVDPGVLDTVLSARVDWGDGTNDTMTVDSVAGTASASHVFGAEGTYLVTVSIEDNGGAVGVDTLIVGKDLVSGGFDEFFLLTAGAFGAPGDQFGAAAAIDGTTAVVGAPFSDDAGNNVGAAFVFEKDGSGWNLEQILTPPNPVDTDQFGVSVAIDGGTLVVGARLRDIPGVANNAGSAFIYERVALPGGDTMWGEPQEVFAADANGGDFFGLAVAVAGNRVVVGAPNDDEAGTDAGAVYVFEKLDGWEQTHKLLDTSGAQSAYDLMGSSVSATSTLIAAGAPANTSQSPSAGKVFVFDQTPGAGWGTHQTLVGSAPASQFGASVNLDDDTLLVGAPREDGEGIAYVTELDGAPSFGPLIALRPIERPLNTRVGQSVGVSGNIAIVGAPFASDSAYAFERRAANDWGGDGNGDGAADQATNFTPTDLQTSAFFGQAVSISGSSVLIGANLDDPLGDASGAAYIFAISQPVLGDNVTVGAGVDIGEGVTVGDNVVLGNRVMVGDNATIGDMVDVGARSTIGSGVVLGAETRVGPISRINKQAKVGAKSRLRAVTLVDEGAQVGEQAELGVRTRVGKASKVGARTNLNVNVEIGSNTFIGDDSRIQTSVRIGDDVVVQADATIARRARIGDSTRIGTGVRIAPGVVIGVGVTIGNDVAIGRQARILDGAVIPDGTVIPARSIVGG